LVLVAPVTVSLILSYSLKRTRTLAIR
jgi:hypothetical protein